MVNKKKLIICGVLSWCGISNSTIETPSYFVTTRNIDPNFLGMSVGAICLAKVCSIRYNIPFYYLPNALDQYLQYPLLEHSAEKIINIESYSAKDLSYEKWLLTDSFLNELKIPQTHFFVWGDTIIDKIEPQWVDEAKKLVQLQSIPTVNKLPENCLTVAVHIRKGNGGYAHLNDGEMVSGQLFDHDKTSITYLPFKDWINYPFENEDVRRNSNGYLIHPHIPGKKYYHHNLDEKWTLKFPPEQYYIDQINWLIDKLKNTSLFIQIFTDDKNPTGLVERIRSRVNSKNRNVTFYYHDNRPNIDTQALIPEDLYNIYRPLIIEDLYNISRFSIFIRGQSYYARAAELMGNHSIVIYPVQFRWDEKNSIKQSIMSTIIVKADNTGMSLLKNPI